MEFDRSRTRTVCNWVDFSCRTILSSFLSERHCEVCSICSNITISAHESSICCHLIFSLLASLGIEVCISCSCRCCSVYFSLVFSLISVDDFLLARCAPISLLDEKGTRLVRGGATRCWRYREFCHTNRSGFSTGLEFCSLTKVENLESAVFTSEHGCESVSIDFQLYYYFYSSFFWFSRIQRHVFWTFYRQFA